MSNAVESPFLKQKGLFKAYDIRGQASLFEANFVHALSRAFASLYCENQVQTVAIGYDARHGSRQIAMALAQGFVDLGVAVQWLGLVTTPIMAFWATYFDKNRADFVGRLGFSEPSLGNGIMVTASHSPKDILGIKWLLNGESPNGDEVLSIFDRLSDFLPDSSDTFLDLLNSQHFQNDLPDCLSDHMQGNRSWIFEDYLSAMLADFLPVAKRLDCVVIDCLNGATSAFAGVVFAQLADRVILLNNQADGDFPKGNPDPMEVGRLQELQAEVLRWRANLGLAFDGDGDRLMVVDDLGRLVSPDYLLCLLARIALSDRLASQDVSGEVDQADCFEVIFDVKCSHHLPRLIEQMGGRAVISQTGSGIMKRMLQTQASRAIFAGELSGHFLFNDGRFIVFDDAMYAGVRLLFWLLGQDRTLSQIVADLPVVVETPDVYLALADGQAPKRFMQQVLDHFLQNVAPTLGDLVQVILIDGLRLDFAHGFGLVRSSNTSASLTLRFAGDTFADFVQIRQFFVDLIVPLDANFASQIAQIQPLNHEVKS